MSKAPKDPTPSNSTANPYGENSPGNQQLMPCLEIGKALTSTLNMDQILVIIIKRISKLLKAKNWTPFLLDPEKQELFFKVVVGLDKKNAEKSTNQCR